jgi:hypothetical protein
MKPGDMVVLDELPPGFLQDLPEEDQYAISEIVGKPVEFVGYDDDGRVELTFTDRNEVIHFMWVGRDFIRPVR